MQGSAFKQILLLTTPFIAFFYSQLSLAGTNAKHLSVISSADPASNAIQSFIIIKQGELLKQGIKHSSKQNPIGQQTPFVIKLIQKPADNQFIQWNIKVRDKQHGTIKLLSEFMAGGKC